MLKKATFALIGIALLWTAVVGVASASPNEQTEITPFEFLMVVLLDADENDALTDEVNDLLADFFFDEAIPSATGETADEVRERLKTRFYPHHSPKPFEVLVAALTGAEESGALTGELSALLADIFIDMAIPRVTGETPEQVRERLYGPTPISV